MSIVLIVLIVVALLSIGIKVHRKRRNRLILLVEWQRRPEYLIADLAMGFCVVEDSWAVTVRDAEPRLGSHAITETVARMPRSAGHAPALPGGYVRGAGPPGPWVRRGPCSPALRRWQWRS